MLAGDIGSDKGENVQNIKHAALSTVPTEASLSNEKKDGCNKADERNRQSMEETKARLLSKRESQKGGAFEGDDGDNTAVNSNNKERAFSEARKMISEESKDELVVEQGKSIWLDG